MVKDRQIRRLSKLKTEGRSLVQSASMSGMDEKTARKYLKADQLPSELKTLHTWRTRQDPFDNVNSDIKAILNRDHRVQAKTIFYYLQQTYPGQFSDGQLRTLQRQIKAWRATCGPAKEIFFEQIHHPGELSQSDFTRMNKLGITISGEPFRHFVFHFVLTYSNWEACSVCFSESFEALSEGLQKALWKLGGVPEKHRTDRLSAAVNNMSNLDEFTRVHQALLDYYGLKGYKIQTGQANENGDVEQSHYRFKTAVDQELILRGSREFSNRAEYDIFLQALVDRRNSGRQKRFDLELPLLRSLPQTRLDTVKRLNVRVQQGSTIRVQGNTYSVNSRLLHERIQVWIKADHLQIWYGQQKLDEFPRLRGKDGHYIQYRHLIDSLVRKPGAFENYRYRNELFPTHYFRMAYDLLKEQEGKKGTREYLKILQLAAKENEAAVDAALSLKINNNRPILFDEIAALVHSPDANMNQRYHSANVEAVDLRVYDALIENREVSNE